MTPARFHSPRIHGFLFGWLLLILLWLPLPLASNRPWAWMVMELLVFGLGLAWLYFFLRGRLGLTPVFIKSWPILLIWGAWLLYPGLQLIPWPLEWLAIISPRAAELRELTINHLPGLLNAPAAWPVSLESHATLHHWLKSLTYFLLFMLALLLVNRRVRLRQLAYALVFSGVFQALYGGFMTLSGLEYGFFYEKLHIRGHATGTFVNRNHLAGYLEMCLALGVGLLIAQLGRDDEWGHNWRSRLRSVIAWLLSYKMRLRLYLVFMVIALVMTHSRMGNSAFFASLIIAGALGLMFSQRAGRGTVILLASLIIIDLFIVGTWFGVKEVVKRLEETRITEETRYVVNQDSLVYLRDYPLTGSGLGSFYAVFPHYQSLGVDVFFDHAHNDYLQFAAEAGIPGLSLLALLVILSFYQAIRVQIQRYDPLCRGMAFGVIMGVSAILIHSGADFNLQIPANAATFVIILAIAWIVRYLPDEAGIHYAIPPLSPKIPPITAILVVFLLLYGLFLVAGHLVADRLNREATRSFGQWKAYQQLSTRNARFAHTALHKALELDPGNPVYLRNLAALYFLFAQQESLKFITPRRAIGETWKYLHQAVRATPALGRNWLRLAWLKYQFREFDEHFIPILRTAAELGKWQSDVQREVMELGLQGWYNLPAEGREVTIETLDWGLRIQPDQQVDDLLREYGRKQVVCDYHPLPEALAAYCHNRD